MRPLDDLLLGPSKPYLRVAQNEIAWTNTVTLGFPPKRDGKATLFFSASLDMPVAVGAPEFTCVACARNFSDFDPGLRIGGMIGVTGTTNQ